jgi:transcriptional regulator with XRE-family HTH domain
MAEIKTIRNLRAARKLSQMQLATMTNLHIATVVRADNAVRVPSKRTLERLASALGVEVHEIDLTPAR